MFVFFKLAGAFGVVYKATFTRPHHGTEVVAVKTIKGKHRLSKSLNDIIILTGNRK